MKKIVGLLVAVVLVAGLWSGGWVYGAGVIRENVAQMAAADGETAPRLVCAQLDVTGFPFRFDVACTGATLNDGDLSVTLAGVRASLLVYNPTHAVVSAASPAVVEDAFTGAQSRLEFDAAQASLKLENPDLVRGLSGEGWRIGRASLVASGLKWTDTLAGETLLASATELEAHVLDIPERLDTSAGLAALAAFAEIDGLDAPGLAIAEGKTTLEAELTGVPADLRGFAEPDFLRRWQAAGGELKLVSLKGESGEEFFEGSGAIKLDAGARPEGQLQVSHKGIVERTGDMIPEPLKPLVLGGQAEDGSYKQTLTLKAGVVMSGLMPVGTLEPLF